MTLSSTVPSHVPSVVSRKTGNEYVLIPVTGNIADMDSVYTLNETGAYIWELIDGKKSVEDITEYVMREFEVDMEAASKDVCTFIEELKQFIIIK